MPAGGGGLTSAVAVAGRLMLRVVATEGGGGEAVTAEVGATI